MIIQRKTIFPEVFESLSFVDAIDVTVSSTDELLGVPVMVGNKPVDDMLTL